MDYNQFVACGNYTNRDWINVGVLSKFHGKEVYPGASFLEVFGYLPEWSNKYTVYDSVSGQGLSYEEQEAIAYAANSRLPTSLEV